MSFTSLLIDSCDIERWTNSGDDDYGQPTEVWAAEHSAQACRLMSTKGREVRVGAELVVSNWKLFIADIDVTEQDRVLLDGDYYDILLVQPMQDSVNGHHLELILLKVE